MQSYEWNNLQTSNIDPETEVMCPFNPYHKMPARTFPSHVKTCPMRTDLTYRMCIYNARHVVDERLFEEHLAQCPDKVYFEKDEANEDTPIPPVPRLSDSPPLPYDEEDWDDEPVTKTNYVPKTKEFKEDASFEDLLYSVPLDVVETVISRCIAENHLVKHIRDDYVSLLSQYCQRKESLHFDFYPSPSKLMGSYCFTCVVGKRAIQSHGLLKTKKVAKQNAAMWALVFLNINLVPEKYRVPILGSLLPKSGVPCPASDTYEP